ncbi:uncharacterized protein [Ptychodera flava]|uniref:uncharacterized protein isoform X2 n=1 Tax=Ptychodera flava TaxID=63121 RepID=UPI00396A530F
MLMMQSGVCHEDLSSLGLVTGSVQRKRRLWSKSKGSKKAKKGEMSAVQDSKKQGFFKSSMKRKQETQLTRETSSGRARLAAAATEKQQGDQVKEEEKKKQKRKKPFIRRPAHKQRLNDRNTYDLEVRVVIKGIIPAEGRSVRAVDSAFFSCYRTRRNAREVARKLSRKGLYVREYDYRRLSFILVCQTIKGVESLMKDYSSARLQQLMEEQFLSLSLNDDIGALYLALQASIDYEEYMMCTEELEEEPWEDPYAVPEVIEVNIADQIKEEELQNIRKTVRELRDDVTRLQTRNIKLTESNEMKYLCIDFQRALSTKEQTRHQCELKSLTLECTQIKADGEREMSSRNALMKMKVALKERAEKIISEALVDSEIKELYQQVRQVEMGIPLKGTRRTLRVHGPIPGHTVWTYGIYVKTNGDLVLCEPENGRVLIMTGDFQCEWVLAFAAFAKPFKPWDVAVNEKGDVYHVCDGGNDQIVVSSVQSAVLKTYGHDEDIIPMSVCLNGDGHSLVADYTGYIRKYDQDGKHVTRSEDGQVVLPLCVRVTSTNDVIVSEERKGIQILDCQFRALRRFGKQILRGPRGLYVDNRDIICVCDWSGGQVARFNIKGVFQGYLYHDQFERPINISMITNDLCRFVVTQGAFVNLLYV